MIDFNSSDYDEGYEESFNHEWPPSDEDINRWTDENEKFLALNENDGSIRA
jgi:hypothetical protein